MTKLYAKVYHDGKVLIHQIKDVAEEDAKFFVQNNILISIEELAGDIIVYGCPRADELEESELIVFANGRPSIEVLAELAEECRHHIKQGLWSDYLDSSSR